jgi:20S proteasome alpha/beta subunit
MTSIVGIKCKDGVVIGSDSSATFIAGQFPTIEQPTRKIHIVRNQIIIAGTGSVGLGQRFHAVVDGVWNTPEVSQKVLQGELSHLDIAMILSRHTIENFKATYSPVGQYGALVAFPIKDKSFLYEFDVQSFQPEYKEDIWYCSMGSAQPITDPFLAFIRDVFWQDGQPTVTEAIFAATWTLDHAIDTNPGGVNGPVYIAVLEGHSESRARLLDDNELDEHRQFIQEAKQALREFRESYKMPSNKGLPDIPKPEIS